MWLSIPYFQRCILGRTVSVRHSKIFTFPGVESAYAAQMLTCILFNGGSAGNGQ